ncbi:MAG: hypothetical protein KAR79_01915 [Simkaniaceae bacterium]|nr:hypothetical protein [Simkaniaceae bacterium]
MSFPLPDLQSEIKFFGKNTRFDVSEEDNFFVLGLKNMKAFQVVRPGEKIYLEYLEGTSDASCQWNFVDEKTPLWLQLRETGDSGILATLNIDLKDEELEEAFSGSQEFDLYEADVSEIESLNYPIDEKYSIAASMLTAAAWWGSDRLYDTYGGAQYQHLQGKERLGVGSGVIYVKKGDKLLFKDGNWKPLQEENTKDSIVAKVEIVAPHKLEIRLWNKGGLDNKLICLSEEKIPPLNFRAEEIFTKIKKRAANRVYCRAFNKSIILKTGDWVLCTSYGARVLKTFSELNQYLENRVNGSLFIFDGIEKQEGREFFVGALFDEMRTQMQQIKLPLQIKQESLKSTKKKNRISSRMRTSNNENVP